MKTKSVRQLVFGKGDRPSSRFDSIEESLFLDDALSEGRADRNLLLNDNGSCHLGM
jgi:hypothetical protein